MRSILSFALAGLSFVFASDVAAQQAVWGVIDCAQSRFVAPSGATCRATNVWGSADGQGQFQSWSIRTDNPYQHLLVQEGRTSISSLYLKNSTGDYIRQVSPRARKAVSFSDKSHHNGSDYVTFLEGNTRSLPQRPCRG
ncbi:MAG: hypothetical protein AAB403_12975 [Planctomycetota bacterium]|mgnify:CR=1 FL=1